MGKSKKLIVVFVIILLVVCVWFIKNNEKKEMQDVVQYSVFNEEKQEIKNKNENIEKQEEVNKEALEEKEQNNDTENKKIEENQQVKKEEKIEIKKEEKKLEETKVENKKEEIVEEVDKKVNIEENKDEININKNDPNFNLNATSLELEKLKSYGLPILIDFGSEGCMPCRQMKPTLIELNEELRGKAIIKYIDVWEYPEAAEGFDFSLIPTQFFINKDGKVYKQHTGILGKEEIINILKEMGME